MSTEIKEKVDEEVKNQKAISITFPVDVFRKLDDYSKRNTGHCYWLAIKQGLDKLEGENEIKMLMDRDDFMMKEIQDLKAELSSFKKKFLGLEEQKDELKHFGEKGDRDE